MELLSAREVLKIVPVSRTTLIRWSIEGKFPKRKVISPRISGWDREEVMEWIAKNISFA